MSLSQRQPLATPRRRKCRNPDCREWFSPRSSFQTWCTPGCGVVVARAMQRKTQRQRDQATLESLKTRRDYLREAQRAFNAFIRERDHDLPCISSGRTRGNDGLLTGSRFDAGHYRSIGACPELRFCELNCHKQSVHDNRSLSGNTVEYRKRLIQRIGIENVAWVEREHAPKHYSADDLKQIRDSYRRKTRELKNRRTS